MQRVPARNNDIVWRNLNGEAVLLNPLDGSYFGLNAVGCSFWEKIDGHRKLQEIIELLLDEYEVERAVLVLDIEEMVDVLVKRGLISF